jgi:hypothetical protein
LAELFRAVSRPADRLETTTLLYLLAAIDKDEPYNIRIIR